MYPPDDRTLYGKRGRMEVIIKIFSMTQYAQNPIFEGALSRTFTILSGLVENLLGSPQKILPPLPPPRNTKKRHFFVMLKA